MTHRILLIAALFVIGCKNPEPIRDPLADNRDSTVAPGANFFYHANGGWFKRNPIPASETSNGIWLTIIDQTKTAVREICENSAKAASPAKGSNVQKIGDFYASGMDSLTIEQAGLHPLDEEFKAIDGIKTIADLTPVIARLQSLQAGPLFSFGVTKDDKRPGFYGVGLFQGGLGLPDRDYYFSKDTRNTKIREAYSAHLGKVFELIGSANSTKSMSQVVTLETALAKSSRTLEALRDPYANYNKMAVSALTQLTPSIRWNEFFTLCGLSKVDSVIVGQPEFFKQLESSLKSTPIEDVKSYLRWSLISTYAPYLSQPFFEENFKFYSQTLRGTKSVKPRWKRVVERTDRSLGEMIGQEYVANYLPKGTKEKLLEIGNNIRDVCRERIKTVSWMSEPTRVTALKKLETMVMKVGYPDTWRDYSELTVDRGAYAGNVMRAHHWSFNYNIRKYGKPVDRMEWNMTPQTYNAYYDPNNNEIVVPACNIIVPGFGKSMPDDAILYGIIGGSTFGHEIIHGFDDQGSQYDEKGGLNNWWTKEDRAQFTEKTKRLISQFNAFTVVDSIHIRGEATLGENIADLGGIQLGYDAFKRTDQYKSGKVIAGLNPDQRYFLSYAYAWQIQERNESLAAKVMSDVHAPAQFRVIGPLSNIPEFFAAFGIKAGDAMYRDENSRVSIW